MNFIEDLKWRGALNQVTDEAGLIEAMASGEIGAYVGTDPTADSLHLGHLIPFMVLKRFQNAGGKAVIIIGGATGAMVIHVQQQNVNYFHQNSYVRMKRNY